MEQIKRQRSSTIHDYDNNKRKKISSKSHISFFEELSNELVYEIFEYLDFQHAFETFYDLNQRFQNLFVHSNLPIKINISSISKSTFHRYLTHIVTPHTDRIKSLRLSNPFTADMILLFFPTMTNLTRLETLIINNIEDDYIKQTVDHLSSLPVLSSLSITSIKSNKIRDDIYQKIFRLPALKYCKMSLEIFSGLSSLSIATNEFSSIEHLVINNEISHNGFDRLLSYVPQLRRLSFGHLNGFRNSQIHKSSTILNYLTDVSLELYFANFTDFEQLVKDYFLQVQTLRITVYSTHFNGSNTEFLNADRWERLISTHIPNLHIFDFQHKHRVLNFNEKQLAYETLVNKFNSLFWMKREWFFEYQYYGKRFDNAVVFYSTNPYRRKFFRLCEEPNKNIWSHHFETNVNSVDHVCIHRPNALKQFVKDFPNVTELTLLEYVDAPRDSLANSLNRIIPVRQLTKLNIDCHRFSFQRLMKLLSLTPNIHTLKLGSILLYQTDSLLMQQNKTFQLVSKTNIITNVTIEQDCTLAKIQLLTKLFPRLEHLTINLSKEHLESIPRFLLSKPSNSIRYLSSLCVTKPRFNLIGKFRILIDSENLLDNYTLKVINQKLYLWW